MIMLDIMLHLHNSVVLPDVHFMSNMKIRIITKFLILFSSQQLKWLARRDFLMFLATQSYLADKMSRYQNHLFFSVYFSYVNAMMFTVRDELNANYQQFYKAESTAVHSVFFMQQLQSYIMSFLGLE